MTNNLIQPLIFNIPKNNFNETFVNTPAEMYIYEFSSDKKSDITISLIPSPYNEWIIGYNTSDKQACFYCIGAVTKLTTVKVKSFENYFCVRFGDKGCYFNNNVPDDTYPVNMLNNVFDYSPEEDSFEYKLINSFRTVKSFKERLRLFNEFLKDSKAYIKVPSNVTTITDIIKKHKGNITISLIAEQLGYSERHISRIFNSVYGFSTKDYCKYIRFQNTLSEIISNPSRENSEFMANTGYSDQAHFQREFKTFTGMTPKQFIKQYKNQ